MVWYGMVWYSMVWYGMVWYGMVWYGMVSIYTTLLPNLCYVYVIGGFGGPQVVLPKLSVHKQNDSYNIIITITITITYK